MRTVAVVDYGMGNLRSVSQAVAHVAREEGGFEVIVTSRPEEVFAPSGSCCPARAPCRTACASCASPGCWKRCSTRRPRKPLMGVCIGMQMLLERSEEGADGDGRRGWA